MENLNIEKFNPLKAEVLELVESVKNTVASSTGADGYELMKENKKVLQKKRTSVVDILKAEREGFIAGQKFVIGLEKDILKLIAEVEDPLTEQIKEIEEAQKREARRELLPDRIEKLMTVEINCSEDDKYIEKLLDMNEKEFAEYFLSVKELYLNKQQEKINAENKRIEDENNKIKLDLYNQRRELLMPYWIFMSAYNKAADYSELSEESFDIILKEAQKMSADAEQKRIDDLEKARLDGIKQAEKDAEEKAKRDAQIEKENQEKLEKKKKYVKFRSDCGWTEETKNDFIEQNTGDKIILYKKVGEFIIK